MSSYYSEAELAEQQRQYLLAQLSKEIEDNRLNILNLQTSINSYIIASPSFAESHHSTINKASETVSISTQSHRTLQANIIHWKKEQQNGTQPTADFSTVLQADEDQNLALQRYQQELEKMVATRAILSKTDFEEKTSLLQSITEILTSVVLPSDAKIELTEKKVKDFLRRGTPIQEINYGKTKDEYTTYITLCKMMHIEPVLTFPNEVKAEIGRLKKELARQREQQYIFETLAEIMASEGNSITATAILEEVTGRIFSVNGSKLCDVFIGVNGTEVLFEPVIDDTQLSANAKRKASEDIKHVCSLYGEIAKKALEKGIILKTLVHEPPSVESCHKKTEHIEQKEYEEYIIIPEEKRMEI